MAVQIFRLRGVPEDEAEEVRQLLQRHAIAFYETPAGNWGISMPALWLRDDSHAERARALIEDYQQQRQQRVRASYRQLQQAGRAPTLLAALRDNPFRFLLYLAVTLLVLYLSIMPFVELLRSALPPAE